MWHKSLQGQGERAQYQRPSPEAWPGPTLVRRQLGNRQQPDRARQQCRADGVNQRATLINGKIRHHALTWALSVPDGAAPVASRTDKEVSPRSPYSAVIATPIWEPMLRNGSIFKKRNCVPLIIATSTVKTS